MADKKVLFVNHVSQISGAEMSMLGLIRGLPEEGFTPEATLPLGPLENQLAERGVPAYPLAFSRLKRRGSPVRLLMTSLRLGMSARLLIRLIRRQRIDLVHANSTTAAVAALVAARRAHVPGIWHLRDLVSLGPLGSWLGHRAARVIAISASVAAAAEHAGVSRERITVIPNGIDPARFSPNPEEGARLRAELQISPETFLVATAGQIVPWKGHHLLLDAVARLRREQHLDIRCLIAGADLFHDHRDYELLLRARTQVPDLAGAVCFTGYRSDITAVYNACDLFVLPSRREPFGRALVEAMACGRPVIAGAEAGPAEILTDRETGLLFPPGDAAALASAIRVLYENRELAARLAETGRQHVLTEYTEARMVARTAALYRELLEKEH